MFIRTTLAATAVVAGTILFSGNALAATAPSSASFGPVPSCGVVPGPCNPGCIPTTPTDCSGTESPAPPVDKNWRKNHPKGGSPTSTPTSDPDSH